MDEEISIIDSKTRNEKIKLFILNNKKKIISLFVIIIIILLSFYSFQIYKDKNKKKLSEKYNESIIQYQNGNEIQIVDTMREIIKDKDTTYSPLALYFLLDNQLIKDRNEINDLFDILINKTSLEIEVKNLIIYKKALYNADQINENDLLNILKPIINSKSVWKSHALYLIAEYFYSNNEKQKAKDFFRKIIEIENANQDIIKETQKRLNRDLSE